MAWSRLTGRARRPDRTAVAADVQLYDPVRRGRRCGLLRQGGMPLGGLDGLPNLVEGEL
jgi:hypothetical protein